MFYAALPARAFSSVLVYKPIYQNKENNAVFCLMLPDQVLVEVINKYN